MPLLWIALGGGLGSVARFLSVRGAKLLLGDQAPWGTAAVNIVGSFAMGFLVATFVRKASSHESVQLFLTTGFLGGFTTFSAFSQDVVGLIQRADYGLAALYLAISVFFSVAACLVGLALAQSYG